MNGEKNEIKNIINNNIPISELDFESSAHWKQLKWRNMEMSEKSGKQVRKTMPKGRSDCNKMTRNSEKENLRIPRK